MSRRRSDSNSASVSHESLDASPGVPAAKRVRRGGGGVPAKCRLWAFTLQCRERIVPGSGGEASQVGVSATQPDVGEDRGAANGASLSGSQYSPRNLAEEKYSSQEGEEEIAARVQRGSQRAPVCASQRGEGSSSERHGPSATPSPEAVQDKLQKCHQIIYYLFQLEAAPATGQLHYQGFLRLTNAVGLKFVKKLFGEWQPHLETCRGSEAQNITYCSKEESRVAGPWEYGERAKQGERSDLQAAVQSILQGGVSACARDHTATFVRYSRGLIAAADALRPLPEFGEFSPRGWQESLLEKLSSSPDDRSIIWIADPDGESGKSYLSRYLQFTKGAMALGGRLQDMQYLYNGEPIAIFDVSRSQQEMIGHMYCMAELLKNGVYVSSKYEPKRKVFTPPHVVFFANIYPDKTKWTKDRYITYKIVDAELVPVSYEELPDAVVVDPVQHSASVSHFRSSLRRV